MRKLRENQCVLVLAVLMLLGAGQARAAKAQEGPKDIGVVRSEEVIERPKEPSGGKSSDAEPNHTYRPSRPFTKAPSAPTKEFSQIGFTIWRLQETKGAKETEQEGDEAHLEQMESTTALTIGSAVRIGIEPLTRNGFLYVIDREQFADGTYGAARLIFPTMRTRNGNNSVHAYELVMIPRPPSYFDVNPSSTGKSQTAEVLTLIFSPTALQLPEPLGDKPMTLSDQLFKSWEAKWSAPINTLELNGGAGLTTSVKAQIEGAKSLDQKGQEAQHLTRADPLPQTIYRATIRRGAALLVTVPLRFKASRAQGE